MPATAVPSGAAVLTVSALTAQIKLVVEDRFQSVWVSGEISNLTKAASGHQYFSLKDDGAVLSSVLFRGVLIRLRFDVCDGMQVIVRGRIGIYPPHGKYQLSVEEIVPKGIGPLELAFQQLKEKLDAKGYFDDRRKKPLPRFPRAIGIVTSPSGAAIRDMLELLSRRWPNAQVTLVPVRVQGDGAAQEIASAIRLLNRLQADGSLHLDALIVGRGGGSLEDLWAFNEEIVADAIFGSSIPIVSAVGHEIDVSVSDLVADHRALTPSHAVTDLTPDRRELLAILGESDARMTDAMRRRFERLRQVLNTIAGRRVFRSPLDKVRELERRLDETDERIRRAGSRLVTKHRDRIASIAAHLESLSPLRVLGRGYSLTRTTDGRVIRNQNEVTVGQVIVTKVGVGEFESRIESIDQTAGVINE